MGALPGPNFRHMELAHAASGDEEVSDEVIGRLLGEWKWVLEEEARIFREAINLWFVHMSRRYPQLSNSEIARMVGPTVPAKAVSLSKAGYAECMDKIMAYVHGDHRGPEPESATYGPFTEAHSDMIARAVDEALTPEERAEADDRARRLTRFINHFVSDLP
ncbi:hypothetical protein ACFWY5_29565 [Nonomuraea sp. NPDC059007]|uniref:hypothetical protein n=1 Tax=Nonomuraea sp. NPDC059007 TaxID=3346692 RepID=UPI0036793800